MHETLNTALFYMSMNDYICETSENNGLHCFSDFDSIKLNR